MMIKAENGVITSVGPVIPVQLWRFIENGHKIDESVLKQIVQENPVSNKGGYHEGFINLKSFRDSYKISYVLGQQIIVQKYSPQTDTFVPTRVFTHGKVEFFINTQYKYIQALGNSWVARKGVNALKSLVQVDIQPLEISDEVLKELAREAFMVTSAKIHPLEHPSLKGISLNGDVFNSNEWVVFNKSLNGSIEYIRMKLKMPSGNLMSFYINKKGTILFYKKGEGIIKSDVDWLISRIIHDEHFKN